MAEQMRPTSPSQAPDPANSYERAHPENEAGMGRMDNNKATPTAQPNRDEQAVKNRQDPDRQINAHEDDASTRDKSDPDHSMQEEEPLDEGPVDINDPRHRRHPRTEGKGGTP